MNRFYKECGKPISNKSKTGYCLEHCRIPDLQNKIKKWLESGELPISANTRPRYYVRDYILKEQNNKCAICGLTNVWNDKALVFILDHINGDATDNCRSNLRLICPNCDSQLDTFKSKNKNSTRTYDKEYRKSNSKRQNDSLAFRQLL